MNFFYRFHIQNLESKRFIEFIEYPVCTKCIKGNQSEVIMHTHTRTHACMHTQTHIHTQLSIRVKKVDLY